MSGPTCKFCSRIRARASEVRDQGQSFSGGLIHATEVRQYPKSETDDAYPVDIVYTQDAETQTSSSGAIIYSSLGDAGILGVDLRAVAGQWKILAVTAQDSK